MTMTHSGRALDSSGSPLNGSHAVTVNLYDDLGLLAWGDTFADVPIQDGYYAVVLGSGAPLSSDALSGDALHMGVSVGGAAEMVSAEPLGSVPFAIRTEETRNLKGGTVEATAIEGDSVTVTGQVSAGSLSTSGALTSDSLSTGALTADSVTTTGDVSAGSLTTTGAVVASSIVADTMTIGGLSVGGPVVGEWYPQSHHSSTSNDYEFMTFNQEHFNTDGAADYFTWDGSGTITFVQEGYYRVDMRTISNNNGEGNHVETWKNGSRLHLSHAMNMGSSWRRHATSVVSHFAVGDTLRVRVHCRNTAVAPTYYCYHAGPDYTALTVQLMR